MVSEDARQARGRAILWFSRGYNQSSWPPGNDKQKDKSPFSLWFRAYTVLDERRESKQRRPIPHSLGIVPLFL